MAGVASKAKRWGIVAMIAIGSCLLIAKLLRTTDTDPSENLATAQNPFVLAVPRDAAWNFGLFAALTDQAEADGFAPPVDAELRDVAEDSKVGLFAEIRVLWDDLQPAAGVTVGAATTFTRHEGTSNQDGTATLGPLVGCPLTVSALSCSGYALQRTDRCDVSPLRTVLTLRKGRTLRGRVVDGEGKPVASVPVSISAEKARFVQAANCVTATTSDATGAFGFQDLQDTLHTLVARPAGRPEVEVKNVAPGPTEVVMVLREQGGTIFGQAVNAKGDAVSSFSLSIVRSPVGAATREPRVVNHAEGRFEENGLPAGLYDVFVATAGGGAVARGVEVKEGARSSEVVLVASLQKSVDGTVVGLASGRPLGGLPVALNCGESRLSSTTAADGSFRFDGAPAGLCALVVAENQPGFIVSNIPLDLSGTEARRAIGRLPLVEAAEPENSAGKSAGIGAQVREIGGKFTVMAVRPGSAADLAGLNPGDVIASVNGQSVESLGLPAMIYLLRGPPGSQVQVVVRSGSRATHAFSIERGSL